MDELRNKCFCKHRTLRLPGEQGKQQFIFLQNLDYLAVDLTYLQRAVAAVFYKFYIILYDQQAVESLAAGRRTFPKTGWQWQIS